MTVYIIEGMYFFFLRDKESGFVLKYQTVQTWNYHKGQNKYLKQVVEGLRTVNVNCLGF